MKTPRQNDIRFRSKVFERIMLIVLFFCGIDAYGQGEIKIVLDEEKDQYLKVSGSMQFWLRHTSLNPGSQINNSEESSVVDLSIRRYRIKFSGKAHEKLSYNFELGNNDLNYNNADRNTPHILDAYIDYQFHKNLAFGVGKHAWAGLSRYGAPSSTTALGHDLDFVAAPYVMIYDDILRRMAIYTRGTLGNADFRFVLAKPSVNKNTTTIGANARFGDRTPEYQFSGYVKYQFLDKESQKSPFSSGSYLAKKNILNLGVGTMYQPNTTWYLEGSDSVYHNATSLAADLFYEKMLPKNRGITIYLAYLHHDLGRNFVRYMGANNPAQSALPTEFVNGKGNNVPVVGTGSILYTQIGYIRPADSNNSTQIQPYATVQYSKFDAFSEAVLTYGGGVNYFIKGHKSKITLGYQNRPVFKTTEHLVVEGMRKDMFVLQYQILFGE